MALHSLYCADVPLRNCSLTHAYYHILALQLDELHVVVFLQNIVTYALHSFQMQKKSTTFQNRPCSLLIHSLAF